MLAKRRNNKKKEMKKFIKYKKYVCRAIIKSKHKFAHG